MTRSVTSQKPPLHNAAQRLSSTRGCADFPPRVEDKSQRVSARETKQAVSRAATCPVSLTTKRTNFHEWGAALPQILLVDMIRICSENS
jgi:hypothetical protein